MRGFTLIELLAVLVIVAVVAGLLAISYQRSPALLVQEEAARLTTALNFAADEAVARNSELGLVLMPDGYRFVAFDPTEQVWLPLSSRPLAAHAFPEAVEAELALREESLDPAVRDRIAASRARGDESRGGAAPPQILLFTSGELTPFTLALQTAEGGAALLQTDGFNPVSWEQVAEGEMR